MKQKLFAAVMVFVVMVTIVRAESLSCQYTVDEPFSVDEEHWYKDENLLEGGPKIEQETDLDVNKRNYRVYNPFDFPILMRIDYDTLSTWYGNGQGGGQGEIPAKASEWISTYHSNSGNIANLRITVLEPSLVRRLEKVTYTRTVCRQCLGSNCVNDGDPCKNPEECGGGYCISNHCSKTENCHNNDCKCDQNSIQCSDNKRCTQKSSILIGGRPICSPLECTTGFVNPQTGLCEKENCDANEVRCTDRRCVIVNTTEVGQQPNCRSEECKTSYLNPETGLCAKKSFWTSFQDWIKNIFS